MLGPEAVLYCDYIAKYYEQNAVQFIENSS